MAIQWGAWEYGGGNGMRVGIEVSRTSVSHSSSSCTVTFKVYTENQYRYNDSQTVAIDGTTNWTNVGYTNNDGTGAVRRTTKTYTYNFDSNDYGSGTAKTVTANVTITGTYNGVTPSKSVSIAIPKRPVAAPAAVSGVNATRVSDGSATVTWTRHDSNAAPYDYQRIDRWDNVTNTWSEYDSNFSGAATSHSVATTANRLYRFRIYVHNSAGWSAGAYSDYIQNTPADPSGCSVSKSSVSSALVTWANGASTTNGYAYDTLLEEQVDGGAWTQIAVIAAGTASYNRTGMTPGSVYAYRVRHRSTVGGTTYSGYSTSGTIQLQSPPAAPTVVSTVRTNDNSFTLNWTNNPNGDVAPYDSLTVQQWDNVSGAWQTLGVLGGTSVSLTDTSTLGNHAYQWRIAANNAAGSSGWAYFATYQTKPSDPIEVKAKAAPGGALRASWINTVSYTDYTTKLRYYKNGVLVDDTIVLAPGENTYLLGGVDLTATYKFGVKTVSTVGYASESVWVDGADVAAATVPNAPASLAPNGVAGDLTRDLTFTWVHSPSLDESDQTAFQIEYSTDGGTTWTSTGQIVSTESSWTMPAGTLANGSDITWHVQTWGVHASPSAYSPTAIFPTSTTPTVTINQPASGVLNISHLDVVWSYADVEVTPQAHWEVELYNNELALLEAKSDDGEATSVTMSTVIIDGSSYVLRIRVQDGDGLQSDWVQRTLFAAFTPPAEPSLSADYSDESGATVLTLTPSEVVAPDTLVATNMLANPSGEVAGYWSGSNVDSTPSDVRAWVGNYSTRLTDGGGGYRQVLSTVAGTTYTATAYVYIPSSVTGTVAPRLGGAALVGFNGEPIVERDQWVRVSMTATVTTGGLLAFYPALGGVGDRWVDGMMVTQGDMPLDYFDGDTPDDDTYRYSWTGAPHASTSEKRHVGNLPPVGVDIQRRLLQPETETWGEWVTLAENVAPDATLIDTTAPIADDGEYRIITYSAAPSAKISEPKPPSGYDDRWVYLSGGPNFTQVCRLMGNIALRTTTTRDRALYNFAGRQKPVMFVGEGRTRVIDVAGLLDAESSSPAEWEHLIANCDVLLFRDPLGHRIFGSVPQVAIDNLGNDMYAISFTVTEVSYP